MTPAARSHGILDRTRRRLAALLTLAALAPAVAAGQGPVHVDPFLLSQYVGEYRLSANYALTILVDGDRLYVRAPNRGTRLLVPTSETEFIEVESGLRITFRIRADTRRVDHLVFEQEGYGRRADRISAEVGSRPRHPAGVDAARGDAGTLRGQYEEQPGFGIAITREGARLLARMTDQEAIEIFAESETDFFYRDRDVRISFRLDGGAADALVWRQGGAALEMRRLD